MPLYHLIPIVWFFVASLTCFILCRFDKRRAKQAGKRRVPEKTFFLWAAFGGAAGLWLGMYTFRHKTRHWYFVVGAPALFFAQIAALAFLHLNFFI